MVQVRSKCGPEQIEDNQGDNIGMNEEPPTNEEQPTPAPAPESQPQDPRRRLRELLAIPERERTDAVWDEISILEIQLAPGNRAPAPQTDVGRRDEPGRRQKQSRPPEQVRRQEVNSGTKPGRRFIKKPKRGRGAPGKT
jgi:hypothetical protein